jgi:hypothetical protein
VFIFAFNPDGCDNDVEEEEKEEATNSSEFEEEWEGSEDGSE